MLDDLKYIHQRDGQDALGIAERQWRQLEENFELPALKGPFENIVYAGMGGSALAALLSRSWPGYKIPFEICRQYHIPAYVSKKTLFIAASYSGNTEETLSVLAEAQSKGAHIVIIASGGKLQEIAKNKSYPYVALPKAEQPRYGVLNNLKAIVAVLEAAKLTDEAEATKQMHETAEFLKQAVRAWLPTVAMKDNPAKNLALEIAGKSPVIYAGSLLAPAAYKWKINFNENAKNVAWWGEYPEFNHNEFIGWAGHPIQKPYEIIDLRSSFDHKRVQKRFELSDRLLSGRRPAANVVQAQGQTILEQLLWTVAYGDFVSIYLALLNGVNPVPVDLVEKLKIELG
ncbi:MAG: bifunctional phosphoglucose/phosphomannose isomerase [Candidatus Saccharimonadales bacterium]